VNSIPGASSLTGLIKDAQTSVMSGLQSAEKLADYIGGQLDNLTALVSKGLPAGAAAELASSVSALSAGGAAAIKLPAIGFNTTDRGSITSQIKSVLGNPKIPIPNLVGEITQDVKDQAQKLLDVGKKYQQLQDKLAEFDKKVFEKLKAYNDAELNLPAGDPAIEKALAEFDKATTDPEYIKLLDQIINLDQINNVAGDLFASAGETASGIANAASSLTSGLSELTGSLSGAVGSVTGGLSSINNSLTSLTKAASSVSSSVSSINTTIKSVTNSVSTVTSSATQVTGTAKTALSSVVGSGSTAIEGIQTQINTSKAELNNTIAGIIGPSGNG
jgi:methyl-accepting chemotaxis protein